MILFHSCLVHASTQQPEPVEPRQRLPEPVRGQQPHPALQAARVHRAPRLHADRVPAATTACGARARSTCRGRTACRRARSKTSLDEITGRSAHDPALPRQAPAARRRGPADPRRPDRRRQVRLACTWRRSRARRACTWSASPICRPRPPAATWRASAGTPTRIQAPSLDAAIKDGRTHVGDDWQALVRHPAIDVVVECTGHPIAAVDHCLEAFANGKHVVNVTVEADAFCGPLLARTGGRRRRRLLARLRRPAGADLRPGRLGAHLRLPGGRRRARPQVAAALRAVHARDGLGLLRPDARAGDARRAEPEDVQQLPRRLQAEHREHRGVQRHRAGGAEQRPAVPAGQRRGHPLRHAAAAARAACWSRRAWSRSSAAWRPTAA